MKKIITLIVVLGFSLHIGAQNTSEVVSEETVKQVYQELLELLKRVEIDNSGSVNAEVYKRWQTMLNELQGSQGEIVSKSTLLIKESLNMDALSKLITIGKKDSTTTLKINPNSFFEEMKKAGKKVTDAAVDMAKTRKR